MTERIRDKIIKMPIPAHRQEHKEGISQAYKTLADCKTLSIRHFTSVVSAMMDKVDDALFNSAEKAENNQIQTLYFDAMREMRIIRNTLEKSFTTTLGNKFDVLTDGLTHSPNIRKSIHRPATLEGIGLVDKDTLEQDLAISTMICKIRQQCKEPLFSLEKRIGFLISEPDLQDTDNPIGPESICHAFKDTTEVIETGIEIRLLVFKLFDQYIASTMNTFYNDINERLIQGGILRDLDPYKCNYNPHALPERYLNSSNPKNTQRQTAPAHMAHTPTNSEEYYNHSPGNKITYITDLTTLQQSGIQNSVFSHSNTTEETPVAYTSNGNNILYGIKESGIGAQLGDNGNIILDIVAMLFDYILDDPHTPDSMRALIGRLQIPVLKVAIIDRTFFSKKAHPARQLLNQLSGIAVGFDDNTDSNDPLFAKVESIIQTVLETFDDDISLFSRLLNDFIAFKDSELASTEKRAQKTVQLVEGQEKVEVARGAAIAETEQRIDNCPDIKIVSEFIKKHWKNLLFLIYARDGKDTDTWKHAINTMDDLIWSVKPKNTEEERHELMLLQPELLNNLRNGMDRLSIPAYERDQFIAELTRLHGRTALDKPPETNDPDIDDNDIETEAINMPVDTPEPVTELPILQDKYYDIATTIEVGTWVKFRNHHTDSVRAKCSWISPLTGTLLFTDRLGRKIESLSQTEFADRLREMRALLIDDTPVLDRAVECTMNNTET